MTTGELQEISSSHQAREGRGHAMNALRTIGQEETPAWVALWLREGPHAGAHVPGYPPCFPFPFRIRQPLQGGWLYLVYREEVYAYGGIARVARHAGSRVGTFAQPVVPGEAIVLAGPARPFPYPLPCRGFAGIRYAPEPLHELPFDAARRIIQRLRLSPA